MKSRATNKFWNAYSALPANLQRLALKQYRLWLVDPRHPSVNFKKVGRYWSARVTDEMIQRMGENDKIVTGYMDDLEFQNSAFPILAREIFKSVMETAL